MHYLQSNYIDSCSLCESEPDGKDTIKKYHLDGSAYWFCSWACWYRWHMKYLGEIGKWGHPIIIEHKA